MTEDKIFYNITFFSECQSVDTGQRYGCQVFIYSKQFQMIHSTAELNYLVQDNLKKKSIIVTATGVLATLHQSQVKPNFQKHNSEQNTLAICIIK